MNISALIALSLLGWFGCVLFFKAAFCFSCSLLRWLFRDRSKGEFRDGLNRFQAGLNDEEIMELIIELDRDKSGTIDKVITT